MFVSLQQQFMEATSKYPTFKQVTPNDFVVFAGRYNEQFCIRITTEYPKVCPVIYYQNRPLKTPLILYWQPSFTFCDIIDYLNAFSNMQAPMVQNITNEEVMKAVGDARYNSLSTEENRNKFLNEIPKIKDAKMKADKAKIVIEQHNSNAAKEVEEINALQENLNKQISLKQTKVQQVNQMRLDPKQIQIESLKNKINQLRTEIQQNKQKVESIKAQFASKSITMDQYAMTLLNAKENIKKNSEIVKVLEKNLPK